MNKMEEDFYFSHRDGEVKGVSAENISLSIGTRAILEEIEVYNMESELIRCLGATHS